MVYVFFLERKVTRGHPSSSKLRRRVSLGHYSPFQKVFGQPGNPITQVTLKMRMIQDSTSESAATSSVNLAPKSK